MARSKIEWTDEVWNIVTGCTKVSAGCKNCYAERIANRFWGERKFTDIRLHYERLNTPLRWRKPRKVFVNSMSDLFHEDVPFEFIRQIWKTISNTLQHTYQILTKRPSRMYKFAQWMAGNDDISIAEWPRNVWIGVSCENQKTADERIPILLQIPAAVRFVSAEPLLGPVNLSCYLHTLWAYNGPDYPDGVSRGLDWVIAGSESGPGARPCDPDWMRSLRDQCVAAGVPLFLKQLTIDGQLVKMPDLDGQKWDQYPKQV